MQQHAHALLQAQRKQPRFNASLTFSQIMSLNPPTPSPLSLAATLRRRAVFVAAWLNPCLNVILAFWALWHCRHARPPASRHRLIAIH